jgi:phosphotriesterase-related protein
MAEVVTAAGPIDPAELGPTSMHEHVLADASCYVEERTDPDTPLTLETAGRVRRDVAALADNLRPADDETLIAELAEFRESGGRALVEMSAPGLRVDVERLARIAAEAQVHVVVPTGLYIQASWPDDVRALDEAALAKRFIAEIEDGIEGTAVRAGHVKVAVTDLSEPERRVLRAAARACNETGVLLSVHPGWEPDNDGRPIADLLLGAGLPAHRLVIAHAEAFFVEHDLERLIKQPDSWRLRLDYHRDLLERGITLSVDCFGHTWDEEPSNWINETDWQRLAGVLKLLEEGHAERLVLGCDVYVKSLLRRGGGDGYRRLFADIVPRLRSLGVAEGDVEAMTVRNPARLLAR